MAFNTIDLRSLNPTPALYTPADNELVIIQAPGNPQPYVITWGRAKALFSAGGSSGHTIQVAGTPFAAQAALNFIAGTNVTLTGTNNTGSGSTDITVGFTGILPVANGGSGTATPGLVAGTNITITGSWPNQTVNASGGGGFTVPAYSALTSASTINIDGTSLYVTNKTLSSALTAITFTFTNVTSGSKGRIWVSKTTATDAVYTFTNGVIVNEGIEENSGVTSTTLTSTSSGVFSIDWEVIAAGSIVSVEIKRRVA